MLKLALRLRWPRPRLARRALFYLPGLVILGWLLSIFVGSNAHAVIDGRVYRTAQLDGDDLAGYIREKNIRTVINLRGHCPEMDWYMAEAAACTAAGVSQEDITLSANRLPPPTELRRLIDVLDHTEYPILFH